MVNLSVVVPCFNEEEVLPETTARLCALLERLRSGGLIDERSRVYYVDDGSRDRTWSLIERFVADGRPVVGVRLTRNRGHQNALLAGLLEANGDAVISVDADLQDDLEAIPRMLDAYRAGAEVVYGVRRRRDSDTFFKRVTAQGFYRLLAFMGAQTVHNHADYRLLGRRAVEALREYREVNLYLRGIVPLIGFKSATVEYDRASRFAGESKYPLRKMLALSIDAITSFSVYPLRLISGFGLLLAGGSMVVTGWALWTALFSGRSVPGWASTVLPMYFLGGVQLLALGVIGEYVGKMYLESKARPRFFIDRVARAPEADVTHPRPASAARSREHSETVP